MWNVKTNVKPVMTGATGTTSKLFRKIPKQHIQKTRNQVDREK
jgi:hypothetical protein